MSANQTDERFQFTEEAQALLHLLEDHQEAMEAYERAFLLDLDSRFNRFGDETFISKKQVQWLRSLAREYAG